MPALERVLLNIATEIWEVEERTRGENHPDLEILHFLNERDRREVIEDRDRCKTASFESLLSRWPSTELSAMAANMYFDSRPWYRRYDFNYGNPAEIRPLLPGQQCIMEYLLRTWIVQHPPTDMIARLRQRIADLFLDPPTWPPFGPEAGDWFIPHMEDCLLLLRGLPGEDATTLVHDVLRGAFGVNLRPSDENTFLHSQRDGSFYPYPHEFIRQGPWMLERVWKAGLLTEELLEGLFRRQLDLTFLATGGHLPGDYYRLYDGLPPELANTVSEFTWHIVHRWAEKVDLENARPLCEVHRLTDSWYLLQACRQVERMGLKRMIPNDYMHRGKIEAAVARMCQVELTASEKADLTHDLQAYCPKTLLLILPVAQGCQDVICQVLDWDGALDLVTIIQKLAYVKETDKVYDVVTPPDPGLGVFNAHEVRDVHSRLGENRFRDLIKVFSACPNGTKNALLLTEACVGTNAAKVEQGFAKRNQWAVRALGLLPIQDMDEVLRRYIALRQFIKESSEFGMRRQMMERAAAEAGLTNLALNAGFADGTRLEWAMEDRLCTAFGASGREWQIDEHYLVKLEVGPRGPELAAHKDGRPLKSLPAAVKQCPAYEEMKEAKSQLRRQASRYRGALEDAMCTGWHLQPGEIEILSRNPAAARMLNALLLVDESGNIGLRNPDTREIEDLQGLRHPLTSQVRIIHPIELHERGLLAAWQREVVHRRIVQPFKQAFREVYVLTPAEEETRVFSRRFAGQVVKSAQAARLLTSEGWDCLSEEYPRKTLLAEGTAACLTFVENYHFMSEFEMLVVDEVSFVPSDERQWLDSDHAPRLPLSEVRPITLSEVMRDLDLVVSVAQYTGEFRGYPEGAQRAQDAPPSAEVIERRADLVRALTSDLGYQNVSIDGQFARIMGTLADYRVHLSSAVIHIEPGAYLCVVPYQWGQRHDRLFLPFDTEDQKTSEVISKVLLLAEDHKIKDESILFQIQRRRQQ